MRRRKGRGVGSEDDDDDDDGDDDDDDGGEREEWKVRETIRLSMVLVSKRVNERVNVCV